MFLYLFDLLVSMPEEEQCMFCSLVSKNSSAKKLYEDDKVAVLLDINPGSFGHLLLIPKQHAMLLPQLPDDVVGHIGMVAKQLSRAVIRGLGVEGCDIFIANGGVAGQRAPHALIHIIPRYKDDKIMMDLHPKTIDPKIMDEIFIKLAPLIKKNLNFEPKVSVNEAEKQDVEKKIEVKDIRKKQDIDDEADVEEKEKSVKSEKKEKTDSKELSKDKKSDNSKPKLDEIAEFLLK